MVLTLMLRFSTFWLTSLNMEAILEIYLVISYMALSVDAPTFYFLCDVGLYSSDKSLAGETRGELLNLRIIPNFFSLSLGETLGMFCVMLKFWRTASWALCLSLMRVSISKCSWISLVNSFSKVALNFVPIISCISSSVFSALIHLSAALSSICSTSNCYADPTQFCV